MQYFELLFSSSIEGTNYNHEYHTCTSGSSYHLRTSPFVTLRLVTQPGDTSSSSTVAGSMSENHRNFLVTQLPPRTSFKSCIFSHHNQKPPVRGFLLALEWREQLSSLSFSLLLPDKVESGNAQEKGKEYPHSYFESWKTIGSPFFFFFFFFFFYKRVPFY